MTAEQIDTSMKCGFCDDAIVTDKVTGLLVGHDASDTRETCGGIGSIPVPVGVDLKMLAWDLSDAFAKTENDHNLDLGIDEIRAALPAFLAEIAAARAKASGVCTTCGSNVILEPDGTLGEHPDAGEDWAVCASSGQRPMRVGV